MMNTILPTYDSKQKSGQYLTELSTVDHTCLKVNIIHISRRYILKGEENIHHAFLYSYVPYGFNLCITSQKIYIGRLNQYNQIKSLKRTQKFLTILVDTEDYTRAGTNAYTLSNFEGQSMPNKRKRYNCSTTTEKQHRRKKSPYKG